MSNELSPRPRADRRATGNPPPESGPLGPAPLPLDEDDGALSLDELADRLAEEDRYQRDRISNVEGALKEASQKVIAFEERHTQATNRLRAIRGNITLHSRQEILETGDEARQAEVKFDGLSKHCEYLRTQLQTAQRALRAIELADHAVRLAMTLTPPDAPAPRPSQALAPSVPAPSVALVSRDDVLAARERERHALARQVQERMSHPLSDAMLSVDLCESALRQNPARAAEAMAGLRRTLNGALRDTRMLIFELEPLTLTELGLAATLEHYARALTVSGAGTALSFTARRPELRFPLEVERAFFRVAREAITNALRHAQARHIRVALTQRTDLLALVVEDDGVGFTVAEAFEEARHNYHAGLGQLRLEARMIGADLFIDSGPGAGTQVTCVLDVPAII